MATTSNLANLQPASVWAHFATLCAIPRASYREVALREHLVAWAQRRGIEAIIDGAGNLILKKPASPGCESVPGVILQGHLDMVCQANSGTRHDFGRDPIRAVVRDGWVIAEDTTLGADNGIGVALALAALEETGLIHPALEVLLTVNEESGMDGARGLAPGALLGRTLINLDTEEWGHFYLGCAGGVDVEVRHECTQQYLPADYVLLRFDVSGLRGGHSGIDIHLGRGNAIKLLAETDANVSFACEHYDTTPDASIPRTEQDSLLAFLDSAVNGVARISGDFPGVTDTSSNLGVVALEHGVFRATFKVRSLQDARADALAGKLVSYAAAHGLQAWKDGAYPGWTPDPSSSLLELCRQVYQEQFGRPASLQAIHAGLECGLLAASHPHLDMISFGPDIRGAHAPGESVEIESVARCWILLKAVLQAMATA